MFIVGMARCGTTALRSTLEALPAFAPRRPSTPETKVFCRPHTIPRIIEAGEAGEAGKEEDDADRLLRFFCGDRAQAERLLEDAAEVRAQTAARRRIFTRVAGRLADKDAVRTIAWRVRGHHHLVRLFFDRARRARGTSRIFEKTPAHATRLPEMAVTFPRLRVVAMFRHPVDAYCSFRKRLQWSEEKGLPERAYAWLRISARRFAKRFRRRYVAVKRFEAARPEQALVLRYEDLTREPAPVLRRICAFIDEPYDEEALVGSRREERTGAGTPKPRARLVENPADWRRWLEEDEVRRIEEMLAAEMAELEYGSALRAD